jgi:hypothetical protein
MQGLAEEGQQEQRCEEQHEGKLFGIWRMHGGSPKLWFDHAGSVTR